jgi:NAD(P)-dependent dehydrogenase (short-subunit alcohol dehydrogenase family)
VFVTTGLARDALPYYGPYAVSKAGLETMVRIYAGEVASTRVRVNLLDPGIVRTRLRARIFPGENPATVPSPESVVDAFLPLVLEECSRNGEIFGAAELPT